MKKLFTILGLCAAMGTAPAAEAESMELLYQRALHLETAKADYDGAIPIYATILSVHAQNAGLAAKSLFRQGLCYEKTGKFELARDCARKLLGAFQAITKSDPEIAKWAVRVSGDSKSEDLAHIKLPDNPSKDEVRAYVRAIVDACRGRRSWSNTDPEVKMLEKVGPKNLDLLIAALAVEPQNFHLRYVIGELVDENSKQLVLENLGACSALVGVVLQQGWEQEAKQTLIKGFGNGNHHLSPEWIEAVAKLKEPSTYPLLRDYFVRGANRYLTYEAIKNLPIENLPGAVQDAWQMTRSLGVGLGLTALIAAEYGHLDALECLFEELTGISGNDEWFAKRARKVIYRVTDFTGSKEEALAWFKTCRENLRFDPEKKRFVFSKESTQSGSPARNAMPAK